MRMHACAQGGRFDHADRLFASVPGAWANCLSASSDVKELLPEFYYCPDFLVNADGHALGTRQVCCSALLAGVTFQAGRLFALLLQAALVCLSPCAPAAAPQPQQAWPVLWQPVVTCVGVIMLCWFDLGLMHVPMSSALPAIIMAMTGRASLCSQHLRAMAFAPYCMVPDQDGCMCA